MTALEQDVREVKSMVRVLLKQFRPTIGFAELKDLLEVSADRAVYSWLSRHKIPSTTRGRYPRVPVYEALELHNARRAAK